MRTLASKLCAAAVIFAARVAIAQEAKVPEASPPPELVGRWIEKSSAHKGELVGYNIYAFSRQAEFLVISRVRNEKTQRWTENKLLYRKERHSLLGYFEATGPGTLRFDVVVLAMAVLPIEVEYKARGDVLTLSKDLFDPTSEREVQCERVGRLPEETPEEFAAFQKRLNGGLNGPDFRRVFEFAAHEMKDHPSDDEMIGNFFEHREEFEALVTMMQADKELKRVDYEWTKPEDPAGIGLTAERIARYRELSRRIGLERGVEAFGESAARVALLASARGLGVSGSCKSYVWLSTPPRQDGERVLVEDLDVYVNKKRQERREYFAKHKRTTPGNLEAYRHVDGNWYLEYESD